jgi:hypothetical protein
VANPKSDPDYSVFITKLKTTVLEAFGSDIGKENSFIFFPGFPPSAHVLGNNRYHPKKAITVTGRGGP